MDMKNLLVLVVVIVICTSLKIFGNDKVIIMGYKEGHKMPLIEETKNDGLYYDLFSKAAEKIGYKLQIVRLPKARLHSEFEKGLADFYPGMSFSERRAEYVVYLDNGLVTKEVIITDKSVPNITDLKQLKGTIIMEIGSSKVEIAKKYNIKMYEGANLDLEKAIKMIQVKRGDYWFADIEEAHYYLKANGLNNFEPIGMKMHGDWNENKPMYIGFATKSKYFKSIPNPKYDSKKPLSYENLPITVDPSSIAGKFHKAVLELKAEGYTQKLYEKYLK